MKSEHRHELQTNTLATTLNDWGDKLRPHMSSIVTALLVLVAVYVIATLWNVRTAQREESAWDAYQVAMLQGDVDFRGVRQAAETADAAGSRMQEWGYITWADRQLRLAANDYLMNREAAKDRLTGVAAVYEQFAVEAEDPIVRSRAQLGRARVSEMENKVEEAREYYADVEGVMAPVAQARLKDLESTPQIAETINWLATAALPKPPAPTSQGGLPGVLPDFDAPLPTSDPSADPFDPARSLEEILGAASGAEGERYEEGAAGDAPAGDGAAADDAAAEPAEDASDAPAQPASDGEAPAADETPAAGDAGADGDAAPADQTPAQQ